MKLLIIQRQLTCTMNTFMSLFNFLPTDKEIQDRLNGAFKNIKEAQEKMQSVKDWCDKKQGV